jgi:hypothetical protein
MGDAVRVNPAMEEVVEPRLIPLVEPRVKPWLTRAEFGILVQVLAEQLKLLPDTVWVSVDPSNTPLAGYVIVTPPI